jgi:hypothetical protein
MAADVGGKIGLRRNFSISWRKLNVIKLLALLMLLKCI